MKDANSMGLCCSADDDASKTGSHLMPAFCPAGQGVDQLADIIRRIKSNPTDRRLVMSAWNPAALHLMALPPCHMFCQVSAVGA
jgi:thymidylate synthase